MLERMSTQLHRKPNRNLMERHRLFCVKEVTPSFNRAGGCGGVGGGDSVCSSEEFALQTILQKLAGRTNYVDIKSKQNPLRLKD